MVGRGKGWWGEGGGTTVEQQGVAALHERVEARHAPAGALVHDRGAVKHDAVAGLEEPPPDRRVGLRALLRLLPSGLARASRPHPRQRGLDGSVVCHAVGAAYKVVGAQALDDVELVPLGLREVVHLRHHAVDRVRGGIRVNTRTRGLQVWAAERACAPAAPPGPSSEARA